MADEAFALSPISARAAQPSAEDYDAISEAFMETSRGRWFLGEYAKRNRNADTRMVLDAVARIEETIAAQRQPQPPDNGLAEALAAIRSALNDARAAASSAIDDLAVEQNLAPVRKGARVIKEIAWRLREIGADGRICDLIDSQVSAIEGACGQISSAGPRGAVSAAFDLIANRIGEFDERDAAAAVPQAAESAVTSSSPASGEMAAAASEETSTASATTDAEVAMGTPVAMSTPALQGEAVVTIEGAADVTAEVADASIEAALEAGEVTVAETLEETAEAAAADDEAVLDMVALEMAAPDSSDTYDISEIETAEIDVVEPPPADPEIAAAEITAAISEPVAAPAPATIQPSQAPLQPALEPSLGSTLLANGIVQKPSASVSDPLAPIRRLSQAEKIALFS
jgi:hypothetical protein